MHVTTGTPEPRSDDEAHAAVLIGGIQLILAQKRTALSVMRTGIAVLALPLAVFSLLIATSRYYSAPDVIHLLLAVVPLCLGLLVLGTYLVIRSLRRIRKCDAEIRQLRRGHPILADFLD